MKLKDFVPDLYVKSIYDIDFLALKETGINSLILDLDNTLVEANSPNHTPELIKWFADLKELGFKLIILSNNKRARVSDFACPLTVPCIHRAMKPFSRSFKKSLEILESSANETAIIGDQLMTDIFGGKRIGIYTILVKPISGTEDKSTKINRKIERLVLQSLKKHGLFPWED